MSIFSLGTYLQCTVTDWHKGKNMGLTSSVVFDLQFIISIMRFANAAASGSKIAVVAALRPTHLHCFMAR